MTQGLAFIRTFLIGFFILAVLFLTACTTNPPKPPSTTLPAHEVKRLQQMHLANQLPVPVHQVKRSQLKDTWGAARSQGRSHEGIDILVPRGTKVLSATDGLVADLRNNNLGGKVIWIMGPAGSWHYYAHLDGHKRGLTVGDVIKKGDVIGYVGNTGNARHTAPHLHYGIYLGGKGRNAINPYPYLR